MIRNLKALGLALIALVALSAFVASAASAANITSSSYPQTLIGEDVGAADQFTVESNAINCEGETYDATLSGASPTIETTPTYPSTCQTVGSGWNVTVTHNGCNFIFHWVSKTADDDDKVSVTVACPINQRIEIHHYNSSPPHGSSSCTNTVGTQNAVGTLNATSETASKDILLHGTVHVTSQTHGACSFGFTINKTSEFHASTTIKTASGAAVHIG